MNKKYISKSKLYTGEFSIVNNNLQLSLDKKSQERLAKNNLKLVRQQNV